MTGVLPAGSRIRRGLVAVLVLVPYAAVGVLSVRATGEGDRQRSEVTRQLQVDCEFYGDIARAPLPPNASELGRRIIRDAVRSYDRRGCERVAGPLPPSAPPSPTRSTGG